MPSNLINTSIRINKISSTHMQIKIYISIINDKYSTVYILKEAMPPKNWYIDVTKSIKIKCILNDR